jgi:hypothetical protein
MLVRTAGEIRGKSIVWTARVFAEAPKIAEKSRKQNPFSTFLVPLSLLSTSPRLLRFLAARAAHPSPSARCPSSSVNRPALITSAGLPSVRSCRWKGRSSMPM